MRFWLLFGLLNTINALVVDRQSSGPQRPFIHTDDNGVVVSQHDWVDLLTQLHALMKNQSSKNSSIQDLHVAINSTFPISHRRDAVYSAIWQPKEKTLHANSCPIAIPPLQCPSTTEDPQETAFNPNLMPLLIDIKLVSAFGDSVTVGIFMRGDASTLFNVITSQPVEDRHYGFTTGAALNALSIGSILQTLSPNTTVLGLTTQRTLAFTKPSQMPFTQLNMGEIKLAIHELYYQVDEYVKRIHTLKMANEWKLMMFFAGGNNLCSACLDDYTDPVTGENMGSLHYIEQSLDRLIQYAYTQTPTNDQGYRKTVLQVYTIYNEPSLLHRATQNEFWCVLVQTFYTMCPCMVDDTGRRFLDNLVHKYNQAIVKGVLKWQSRTDIDPTFRVSVMRTMEHLDLGTAAVARKYLSDTDCFHPNECWNRLVAFTAFQKMSVGPDSKSLRWKSCEYYREARLVQ